MVQAGQRLTVDILRPGMEADFQALLRIYEAALSASSRKSESAVRSMLANPVYIFLLARLEADVVGFAIVARFAPGAALLEYIAVDPSRQGSGIGSWLFRECACPDIIGSRWLLIEAESPDAAASDREAEMRRIGFYRRLGCRQLSGLAWRMPPVSSEEPPPMNLYLFAKNSPSALSKAQLRAWIEAIYAEVYGCSRQDPRIGEMLHGLPAEIPLI